MEYKEIIKKLKSLKNPNNVLGMGRFGIKPKSKILGVPIPEIRKIAKEIKKNHKLALKIFDSDIHEAKILATIIADPKELTEEQIEKWVKSFDSWDIVDQFCMNLISRNPKLAHNKVFYFSKKEKEFEKRTAFSLIAALAVHDRMAKDKEFLKFFNLIKKFSKDDRNFVKKAVNWALRQIGKRNKYLNIKAIKLAKDIQKINSKSAKWIANNAIRELTSEKVQKKL